jgi:hypothetical protein
VEANGKSRAMPAPLVLWKWTSISNLGLVPATSAYHWPLDNANPTIEVFDRHPTLSLNCQIITYQISPHMKWCILGGISL